MHPPSVIQEIKDRLSIVGLIGEHVALKKAGRNHKGLCPFHKEKTPSFMVSDEKQIFHCFGCGEGGDCFRFLMKQEGLNFGEALKTLAGRTGVTLPEPEGGKGRRTEEETEARHRRLLGRVNQLALEYYQQRLAETKAGEFARNYLISRDYSENSFWTQHFLGYAEDEWDGLTRYLKERKVPMEFALELGLVRPKKGGEGYYDFFRHRLIFPICTPRGEVCGFGGRALPRKDGSADTEAAKYLNSQDSLLFQKRRTVYGLPTALPAIRANDRVLIVEGYLDALACYRAGIMEVVAPLGTALTAEHIRLLKRYTRNCWVVFDGDAAGVQAARRSLPLFLAEDLIPRVVLLPAGEDPDTLLKKQTKEVLLTLVTNAPLLFDWLIDDTVAGCGGDTAGKRRTVEILRPLFAQVSDPIEEAGYLARLANRLRLEEGIVRRGLKSARGLIERGAEGGAFLRQGGARQGPPAERALLEFLFQVPSAMALVAHRLQPAEFTETSYRAIAEHCWQVYDARGELRVAWVVEAAGESLGAAITGLAFVEGKYDDSAAWPRVAEDLVAAVRRPQWQGQLQQLNTAIAQAEQSGRVEEVHQLMTAKAQLLKTERTTWNGNP